MNILSSRAHLSYRAKLGHYMPKALYSTNDKYDATKYRHWINVAEPCEDTKESIRVMSFNLLSQHYVWDEVFRDFDPKYMAWDTHRFPLINQTIAQLQCDIMCFQEMEYDVYLKYWEHNLTDYTSVFVKKSLPLYWGEKPSAHIDGVSIFVNKNRFEILASEQINFGNYIIEHKNEFEITDDLVKRVVPRNTVAVIVKLRDKLTNKIVYVANTHLYWSPRFNDVKLIQAKILLNILRRFTDQTPNPHVIMAGDFNSNNKSWTVQLLGSPQMTVPSDLHYNYGQNNQLVGHNNTIINPLDLQNTHETLLESSKLTFTSYTKALTDVLDHIFVSKNLLKTTKILSQVNEEYCSTAHGFPNEQFPSDHIPLVVQLEYCD